MRKKRGPDRSDAARRCRGLYKLIRARLGDDISDREIARRWGMEWKSFAALKHGKRQVPRIDELERLAGVLEVPVAEVFAAASSAPAGASAPATVREALRLTVDRVPDALLTLDVEGRIHDFNRALPALTGRADGELRGRPLVELVELDSTARALACIGAAARDGQASETEVALDGRKPPRIVALRATPLRGPDGAIVGAQVVAHQIAAGDRTEAPPAALPGSMPASVFDRIPAACILCDGEGTILAANKLVENVCSLSAAEIIGHNAATAFGDTSSDGGLVMRALRQRRVEQQVSWMTNRRGQPVYVHRTAGPVFDSRGGVRVIEVMVDATAQLRNGDLRVVSLWRPGRDTRSRVAAERRVSPRAETAFVVKYRFRREQREARVENLGQGGLFIQTDEALSQGERLELEWRLPGEDAPVRAVGVVAWQRAASREAPAGLGVRFVDVSPDPMASELSL